MYTIPLLIEDIGVSDMKTKKYFKYLSFVIIISIIFCMISPMAAYSVETSEVSSDDDVQISAYVQNSDYVMPEYSIPEVVPYNPEKEIELSESEKLSVYEDSKIIIYNYEQLLRICSNTPLTDGDSKTETVGKGEPVLNEDGDIVLYRPGSKYRFAHDIALPKHKTWQLPDNFSGSISNGQPKETPLYDSETDTVYIYNPYQLEVMAMENADSQPILDGDAQSDTFGTGKLIFPNGEDKPYLTYSSSHNYVLSEYFNSAVKNSVSVRKSAPALRNTRSSAQYDGRDFQGQVVKNLNNTKYILIGNEDQLRAIGTDAPVYSAVYEKNGTTMVYGGDADLLQSQNGNRDFAFQNFSGNMTYYGQNQETGVIGGAVGYAYDTGEKYSNTANYIVFRDIDLEYRLWTPKMFYGTMTGAKAVQSSEKLWDNTSITAQTRPVISNVSINQASAIDVTEYVGVGFFATLTTVPGGKTAKVDNIELNNVSVTNNTNQLYSSKDAATLVGTLLDVLGGGLVGQAAGSLLDRLLKILTGGNFGLQSTLTKLLTAKQADKTNLATGAFAGRIVGDVDVERCAVTGRVTVTSINDRTGGFVGYSNGEIEYFLGNTLDGLVGGLASILNVIPGVGLGELVTVLLGNVLPLSKLAPTGYTNPVIKDCEVNGLAGGIGQLNKSFIGGFVGQQTGTIIENCEVKNSDYTVQAERFGGGFSGIAMDEAIRSLLSDVGIDFGTLGTLLSRLTGNDMIPKSVLKDCEIKDSTVTVNGTENLGGFTGALCSSYAVNCSIDGQEENSLKVIGSGDYVGGFCGEASLGWFLIDNYQNNPSLLSTVGSIVSHLVGDGKSTLLSLAGAEPSAIMGVEMDCGEIEVSGRKYVGGILGRGDGVYITESSDENLQNLAFWKYDKFPSPEESEVRDNYVNNLKGVVASDSYAGGIAGSVGTASAAGLLNTTLGVGDFIGFDVSNVTVNGIEGGYAVAATNNCAGGGFGETIGGTIDNVTLRELKLVSADNRAAGFTACSGPGDLAGTDSGLSVHLLGLDNVLEAKNLLALGQGVEVEITNCNVYGIESGFVVQSTHDTQPSDAYKYTAGGFAAKSNSTKIENSHVHNLHHVSANAEKGYAGGFIGTSETGGLADVADEDSIGTLIQADNLVGAIEYLIPEYTNCTVTYVNGGFVQADYAGGFVADLQSGTVNNFEQVKKNNDNTDENVTEDNNAFSEAAKHKGYAVYNIDHVTGYSYGGGFGGELVSGALADAGGGISILGGSGLSLDIEKLLGVVNAYIPIVKYAGVYSENGFTVAAYDVSEGNAGGFAGCMKGAQISYSDVNKLKHTNVTPPDDLETVNAPTYLTAASDYAVRGGKYAGGYVGNMDIGDAASVGDGLKVLGTVNIGSLLSAVQAVVSTIEHSDTMGAAGGFSVISSGYVIQNGENKPVGMAGGFAGNISGGHIQDSHSRNFAYIVGAEAAGGYVGNFVPGNVASVLGNVDTSSEESENNYILKLINIGGTLVELRQLLTVLEAFVPTIRNSTTTCIPCGGAVRAYAPSDDQVQRGMAGGYCGHNEGGQIWGYSNDTWKDQNNGVLFEQEEGEEERLIFRPIQTNNANVGSYQGPQSECRADRIRSVYGFEYAGGFTGFMETADTSDTGNLSLLGNLIKVNSILSVLSMVYPTEKNTAVYGPLSNLDVDTWNMWIDYVGKYGQHGIELLKEGKAKTQAELDSKLSKYIYGYNVVAGRYTVFNTNEQGEEYYPITEGGNAGGYVGYMLSGVITNGQGYDAKLVRAMRSSGGFAGKMQTGGAADFGGVELLGLNLSLGSLLSAVSLFVPTVKSSSIRGWQSGLTVMATGDDFIHKCGYAGGYVGSAYGAQIWGDENIGNTAPTGCNVTNLKFVQGRNAIGGYVGLATAASVADVNTNASSGILQSVLDSVLSSPGDLAQVVQATVTTIRQAEVSAYKIRFFNKAPACCRKRRYTNILCKICRRFCRCS